LLRLLFAIEACGIVYVLFIAPHLAKTPNATLSRFGLSVYAIGVFVLVLYVIAFWTTRKPLLRPNVPAMAACLLNAVAAVYFLYDRSSSTGSTVLNAMFAAAD